MEILTAFFCLAGDAAVGAAAEAATGALLLVLLIAAVAVNLPATIVALAGDGG